MLSVEGMLVLIKSVLSSPPMFMMSFFEIPRGVLKTLDYFRSRFFWQSDEHKKKILIDKVGGSMYTKRPRRIGSPKFRCSQ